MRSSEFIKGYTEMIVCALLYEGDDYIYNIVKSITENGGREIQITNPSLIMIMKKMTADGKITSYSSVGKTGVDRRYYSLTESGREYYLKNREVYLGSLETLKNLILGVHDNEGKN